MFGIFFWFCHLFIFSIFLVLGLGFFLGKKKFINICFYAWIYICVYVCMYVCMYLCMHACMYMNVHMYVYTFTSSEIPTLTYSTITVCIKYISSRITVSLFESGSVTSSATVFISMLNGLSLLPLKRFLYEPWYTNMYVIYIYMCWCM